MSDTEKSLVNDLPGFIDSWQNQRELENKVFLALESGPK